MIVVTQAQLKNKDTEALVLIRNEIKSQFNTIVIDYFVISAIAEILYNRFKDKHHDIIYKTSIINDEVRKPFNIRINYGKK